MLCGGRPLCDVRHFGLQLSKGHIDEENQKGDRQIQFVR